MQSYINAKLSITLDIGYIYDFLSILNTKISKLSGPKKDTAISSFESIAAEIKSQIGQKLFDDIISSDEYKELYEVNLSIFNDIDKLRKYESLQESARLGLQIDANNTLRFKLKNKLQSKFFGAETDEIKT